ncbi:hypothetical protein NB607_15250 [Vibrio alginolyticus]|uniref:hypothetical protein n=1 Tax=Vibrio alginolyticus TaxID=663 RepID=UPI00215BF88E|nr:hypothetical protein [Vibrio alginolyticus]MCS0038324.1 hypothetical protein [Vibrio alginolyticus]
MMKMTINLSPLRSKALTGTACVLVTAFVLRAFINGLGCRFTLESESKSYIQKSYCKMGILIIETHDKLNGEIKVKKMRWGFWAGYNYTLHINTKTIRHPDTAIFSKTARYDAYNLIGGKSYSVKDKGKIAWVYDEPFEVIYLTSDKAKLALYEKRTR